jgi:hypothetical protein
MARIDLRGRRSLCPCFRPDQRRGGPQRRRRDQCGSARGLSKSPTASQRCNALVSFPPYLMVRSGLIADGINAGSKIQKNIISGRNEFWLVCIVGQQRNKRNFLDTIRLRLLFPNDLDRDPCGLLSNSLALIFVVANWLPACDYRRA